MLGFTFLPKIKLTFLICGEIADRIETQIKVRKHWQDMKPDMFTFASV